MVEHLERVVLLSTVNEFPIPTAESNPYGPVSDSSGNFWFTEWNSSKVGEFDPTTQAFHEYTIPTADSVPNGITYADGSIWFTELNGNKVGEFDPTTQTFHEYSIPTADSEPYEITADADGNLWFTESNSGNIGEFVPATQTFHEYSIPTADSEPDGITAAADGNIWFIETSGNKVGEFVPATQTFHEYSIPTADSLPFEITADADGNIWFTEEDGNKVGEFVPATQTFHEYSIPTAESQPYGITADADGNIWFTEENSGNIGEFVPATQTFHESPIPTADGQPDGITAAADGNIWFTEQNGGNLGELITLQATTTSLSASPTTAAPGQSVTFTATVAPQTGAGAPTGSVEFMEGTTVLGTESLDGTGTATFSTSSLPQGVTDVVAVYEGDEDFQGSESDSASVDVQAATTTALSASPTTAAPGQSVTFTATVAPQTGTGAPTGSVEFMEGTTVLGTESLDGTGTATFSTAALPQGVTDVVAVYEGDSTYATSTSGSAEVDVQASTTTALSASPTTASPGQSVTFTATVAGAQGSEGAPTGSVEFMEGSTELGTESLDGTGTATFSTSTLWQGVHDVVAVYEGDENFQGSESDSASVDVQASTTTAVSASPNPAALGQSVTLTATVTKGKSEGAPTGSVEFMEGTTVLGTESLDGTGTATFSTAALPQGVHDVVAVYEGDEDFQGSDSDSAEVDVQASTTTALSASPTTAAPGQPVTFTATIAGQAESTGTATGTVEFLEGDTVLGTATLDGTGTATFSTSDLPQGVQSIVAVYEGDAYFQGSTSTAASVDVEAVSGTTVSATPGTSIVGQAITLTATVAGASPTGTVAFFAGATELGTDAVGEDGQAVLTVSTLGIGSYAITATYGGDSNNLPSQSGAAPLTVNPQPTTTTIGTSATAVTYGQAVTFTVNVAATATADLTVEGVASAAETVSMPTGTVTFLDNGTAMGTVAVDASGQATLTSAALPPGMNVITAAYSGDSLDSPSTSNVASVSVSQVSTTTTLTSSANPSTFGQSVTFTAAVGTGNGVPTGTVTFLDGGTVLGTAALDASGIATFTTTALPAGAGAITAVYGGGANFLASTSAALAQQVDPAAAAAPPTVTGLARYGYHAQPTILVLSFSGPLDASRAENPANYTIVGPGLIGRARVHAVASAVYDANAATVTLYLSQRLNVHLRYGLTVNGTSPDGLTGPSGVLLDGAGTGQPGSNYTTVVSREILAGRASAVDGAATAARNLAARGAGRHAISAHAVDTLLSTGALHARPHRARR